jgi:hypothetical protein
MNKQESRRQFLRTAVAGVAGAGVVGLAGMKPAGSVVLAQASDYQNNQVLDGAMAEMEPWRYLGNGDPFNYGHFGRFAQAAIATIGVARQYGLDAAMDEAGGDQPWIAYMEGGWNEYWSLITFGLMGAVSDWFAMHPEQGSWEGYRTRIQGSQWINGYGPLSSEIGVSGLTELPLWPDSFWWSTEGVVQAVHPIQDPDDSTVHTIGPPPVEGVPFYSPYNSYVPNLILGPMPVLWPDIPNKCKWLQAVIQALGTVFTVRALSDPNVDVKAKIVLTTVVGTLQVAKTIFC